MIDSNILELMKKQYIPLDLFLSEVIKHYYKTRENPIPKDFITAPEVSQLFGEVVAIWIMDVWMRYGKPKFVLTELGAGNGTMMADIIRATKHVLHPFMEINILEISPKLIEKQKEKLGAYHNIKWISDLSQEDDRFQIIISNEFFDALPIKQFIKNESGKFNELLIGFPSDSFSFAKNPIEQDLPFKEDFVEISYESHRWCGLIKNKIKGRGASLIIDYGYTLKPNTSTIQAICEHNKIYFLEKLGEADITSLVDFESLKKQFDGMQCALVTQKEFLEHYFIHERASKLGLAQSEYQRLISNDQMGELFKVLMVYG